MPPRRTSPHAPVGSAKNTGRRAGNNTISRGTKRLRAASARELPFADFADAEIAHHTVPTRWVKALVGLFLLPFAWVGTKTFFGALAWVTLEKHFWLTEEFWFFGLGALLWMLIFFTLPRPMRVYVFGHELTHALTVWLMGGKVEEIAVRRDGGHVLADKVNTWIALSPYFIPLYSVIVLVAYCVLALFTDPDPFYRWMLGGLGCTWAFHLSFTCWMIPKGQSDLAYGGHFFSLVIIYLANLLLLSALLILGSPEVSPRLFFEAMAANAMDFMAAVDWALRHAFAFIERLSGLDSFFSRESPDLPDAPIISRA
jgi:hypothetical protein